MRQGGEVEGREAKFDAGEAFIVFMAAPPRREG
jgi:hypothetical protein